MKDERMIGPLGNSLKNRINDEQRGFGNFNNDIDSYISRAPINSKSKEVEAAYRISLRALMNQHVESIYHDLIRAIRLCESPIEEILLAAFISVSAERQFGLKIHNNKNLIEFTMKMYPELTILPQAQIGVHRTDFLLRYEDIIPDFDNKVKIRGGQEIPGSENVISKIIVECDGHDFHEKTKGQAKKDKQRDRILQSTGFKVFRFTGSEIWDDPIKCVDEVFVELEKASDGF
ncbi:MAG: DUF559 domain-containing protein [bacterium]